MKRQRFSEEQIMRSLHEAEMLDNVREVCRQHNIAEQTLYRWRRQLVGLDISEAKRLRILFRNEMDRLLATLFVHVCNSQSGTFSRKCPGCGSPNP